MFQCVLSYRSETGSISGSSVLQKRSDIDALRRFILRTAELYNYKNPVQHNMLFLLFYIIIILASISVNIIAYVVVVVAVSWPIRIVREV